MCAIYGMVTKEPDPAMVGKFFNGFAHLQHRGQESAGVAYSDGDILWTHKGMGLIQSVFGEDRTRKKEDIMNRIISRNPVMIVGQTRYSTSGEKSSRDMPPQYIDHLSGKIALVHNGNLPNAHHDRDRFGKFGVKFNSDHDTELMLKKIIYYSQNRRLDLQKGIFKFMQDTHGTYSAALLNAAGLYLFRDPWGNRPMFYIDNENYLFFSSETCALDHLEGEIEEVLPGSIMFRDPRGRVCNLASGRSFALSSDRAHCVFEKIYFARPDSRTFSTETEGMFRFRLGQKLAQQFPLKKADFVSGMPDSGRPAAEGYAFELGVPLVSIFVRDRYYMTRNFINPPGERKADLKYHLMKEFVKDKVIVLVDDSIVRGDTLKDRVKELHNAGAKEVHIRISSPRLISPCYYGIDIASSGEIIGATNTAKMICEFLGADSLKYLDEVFLREVISDRGDDPNQYCMACFNQTYPINLD